MEIEYKEVIDKEIESILDMEFEKYANKNNIICNYKPFNIIAKNNNKIIGILTGYYVYDEVHIEMLLVIEKYRNNGIGTQLMKEVEIYSRRKKFNYISLVTCEFQAPEFYKKCGFTIEFIRENKTNDKLNQYFLIKYL